MFKKFPVIMAVALAAALWMLSGGALLASAQDSSAASDSAATPMFPADEAIPAGSTFIPAGTTSGGTAIPDGSILLTAGAALSDSTVVAAGTVLYPDGSLVMFSDSGAWPAGDAVPADFVFAPVDLPFVVVDGNGLPITGGGQGTLAVFGISFIAMGAAAFVARERLTFD